MTKSEFETTCKLIFDAIDDDDESIRRVVYIMIVLKHDDSKYNELAGYSYDDFKNIIYEYMLECNDENMKCFGAYIKHVFVQYAGNFAVPEMVLGKIIKKV